jgi:adenylate cyclase
MSEEAIQKKPFDDVWYWYLTGENREKIEGQFDLLLKIEQLLFRFLPGTPRCTECNVPLAGIGRVVTKPLGLAPSTFSPRLCNACEKALRKFEGGAEVRLSMLFADVRGSTELAASLHPVEFKKLIQRFYKVTTDVLVRHYAMINRLMGDQVIGLFTPRLTGQDHARVAVDAAIDLLQATGHSDPGGPWVPVGVGVHTGKVYVGFVGSRDSVSEIAVLGNDANLAARLSSQAKPGEVIISEATAASAGFEGEGLEPRSLSLKGYSEPVPVRVKTL